MEARANTKGAESTKQSEFGAETLQAALPTLHVPQDGVRQKLEAPNVAEPRRVDAALRRETTTHSSAAARITVTM